MWERQTNIKRKPEPPQHFAVIDTSQTKPPAGQETFSSYGSTHGLVGLVVETFENRQVRLGTKTEGE